MSHNQRSNAVYLACENLTKITASALSLNIEDVTASANFVKQHFGFSEEMSAKGFVSLSRPDAGFNFVFLKIGLESFKPIHMRGHRADGLLIAFVVDDIDHEYARLQAEGVTIKTEPWGESFFQVTAPNCVVIQFKTFRTIAQTCDGLGCQLVISLGKHLDTTALPTFAGSPIVVGYAPQLQLLQQAKLVITHAGMNTALKTLSCGVPMVAIPITNA